MQITLDGFDDGMTIGGHHVNKLRYAGDTTLVASWKAKVQDLVGRAPRTSEDGGLFLNVKKTNLLQINVDDTNTKERIQIVFIIDLAFSTLITGPNSLQTTNEKSFDETALIPVLLSATQPK